MSDPTRLHRDPATAHTGTGPVTPPGEHPAETRARTFADAPAGTPPGGVWSAYDDAFMEEPDYDPFYEEESYLYYGGPEAYDDFDDDLYGDDEDGFAADIAERGRSAGASLLSMARENPVGTALAAAGIALLFAPRIEREDARAAVYRARARGQSAYRRARGEARSRMAGPRARLRAGADEASTRASDESHRLRRRLERMREQVREGTENMSSEARDRIVAARMRTIAAREKALDHADDLRARAGSAARRGAREAQAGIEEHPLIAGTLAIALGAALGAALPRTRIEDSRLGGLSDRLMREAENIYEREREMIAGAAQGAWDEMRQMASETAREARESIPDGQKAVEQAESHLREGTARVVEGARKGAGQSDT
jgi:gas vesicle protein